MFKSFVIAQGPTADWHDNTALSLYAYTSRVSLPGEIKFWQGKYFSYLSLLCRCILDSMVEETNEGKMDAEK